MTLRPVIHLEKKSSLHSQDTLLSGQTRLPIGSPHLLLPGPSYGPPCMAWPWSDATSATTDFPSQKARFGCRTFSHSHIVTTSHVLGSMPVPCILVSSFCFIYVFYQFVLLKPFTFPSHFILVDVFGTPKRLISQNTEVLEARTESVHLHPFLVPAST